MVEITAKAVMDLRKTTGVSMMACKKALVEAKGDVDLAIDILRKAGAARAEKKGDRATGEGAMAVSGRAIVAVGCETDFVARNEDFLAFLDLLAKTANSDGKAAAEALFEKEKAEKITTLGENLSLSSVTIVEGGNTVGGYLHSNRRVASVVVLEGADEETARDVAMHATASFPRVVSPDEIDDTLVAKEREIWEEQLKNEGKPEAIMANILAGKEKKFREENALEKQSFVKNTDLSVEKFVASKGGKIVAFARISV